jgi:hypothetical protein
MDSLERAMNANRPDIERALAAAEEELHELQTRERSVQESIRRARLFLGMDPMIAVPGSTADSESEGPRLVLHEALAQILRAHGNRPMTARELADEVNESGLYRKRDGSDVEPGQIHARVHNYDRLFERAGGGIRLASEPAAMVPGTVIARFDAAMLEVYGSAMREVRYPARRFLAMVRGRGGVEAARQLLSKLGVSEGFRRLAEARKLNLTMEYQVLQPEFRVLFADEERAVARQRLLDAGMPERDLPH